jgi:hypothetical protein
MKTSYLYNLIQKQRRQTLARKSIQLRYVEVADKNKILLIIIIICFFTIEPPTPQFTPEIEPATLSRVNNLII